VIFDGNASGKTITTSSSGADDFGVVKFTTAGGEWTLQDELTAGAVTISNGTLVTGANKLIATGLTISGGTLTASSGDLDINGDVAVSSEH